MNTADAQFVGSAARWEDLPDDGRPEVAFVGRSNVGKSSLINALLRRKNLARTSGRPGKTQTFNHYLVDGRFYLVDLPGYGYAKASKEARERWRRLIERYLAERRPLRLVVHLVDSRHPPTALDEDVIAAVTGPRVPYLVALTKVDKLSGNERTRCRRRMEEVLLPFGLEAPIVLTSAKTGRGRKELLSWIGDLAT